MYSFTTKKGVTCQSFRTKQKRYKTYNSNYFPPLTQRVLYEKQLISYYRVRFVTPARRTARGGSAMSISIIINSSVQAFPEVYNSFMSRTIIDRIMRNSIMKKF